MRLGVVAWSRKEPAPHELADGRCSAGKTIFLNLNASTAASSSADNMT